MSTPGATSHANASENTAMASPSTPEANMLPDVGDKVHDSFSPPVTSLTCTAHFFCLHDPN
jgi:hypothetical protein